MSGPPRISATLHTDPGCPWAYSAIPALRVMEWRYGNGLDWRLVMIGLAEDAGVYAARGYTPAVVAEGHREFRDRFGMPFDLAPKPHVPGTGRACRAVVAARLERAGAEWAALRALQLAWFTSPIMLDDDADLAAALAEVPGLDGRAVAGRLGDAATESAYQADRAEARAAAGSPAEAQGKTATTDGPVRFTAPTLVLEAGSRRPRAVAGALPRGARDGRGRRAARPGQRRARPRRGRGRSPADGRRGAGDARPPRPRRALARRLSPRSHPPGG